MSSSDQDPRVAVELDLHSDRLDGLATASCTAITGSRSSSKMPGRTGLPVDGGPSENVSSLKGSPTLLTPAVSSVGLNRCPYWRPQPPARPPLPSAESLPFRRADQSEDTTLLR